jgi:hypothetical protein
MSVAPRVHGSTAGATSAIRRAGPCDRFADVDPELAQCWRPASRVTKGGRSWTRSRRCHSRPRQPGSQPVPAGATSVYDEHPVRSIVTDVDTHGPSFGRVASRARSSCERFSPMSITRTMARGLGPARSGRFCFAHKPAPAYARPVLSPPGLLFPVASGRAIACGPNEVGEGSTHLVLSCRSIPKAVVARAAGSHGPIDLRYRRRGHVTADLDPCCGCMRPPVTRRSRRHCAWAG